MTTEHDKLVEDSARARELAHEAPMNIYHENHDGHRWVEIVSRAWADRTNDLLRIRALLSPNDRGEQ